MIENNTPIDQILYVEICKTITMKAWEHIRKHNLDETRETIQESASITSSEANSLDKKPDDNTYRQTGLDPITR